MFKLIPKSEYCTKIKKICINKDEMDGLSLCLTEDYETKIVTLHIDEDLDINKCVCHECNNISSDQVICRICFKIICNKHRYLAKYEKSKVYVCNECKTDLKELKVNKNNKKLLKS